ncbi:MAG: UTP--glucose-1-phosphate uridylyltransferase GalU [Magnetococcales bacterium]|nr:UTP--glucose-1-phosphate uridylyltransferase GalU [Magnetococcales bacterium]
MKVRKAVLPVAGMGTRFLPATKVSPKEMLTVVDKPLVQYAIEEAFAAGIEQVILVNGRGKGVLEDHFDRAPELEESLKSRGKEALLDLVHASTPQPGRVVSVRQMQALGLGHAVLCAREAVGNEPFAILLPDDLMWGEPPVLKQMTEAFETTQRSMLAVMEVPSDQTDKYGILDIMEEGTGGGDGRLSQIRAMVEKPPPGSAPSNLAVMGRYILTPEIFPLLARQGSGAGGEIQLTDAMAALLSEQTIHGFRFQGTRYDCGDKAGWQMANLSLALERDDLRERLLPFLRETLEVWQNNQSSKD